MLTLRDIMRADLFTVTPDTSVETLVELLSSRRVTGVPVVLIHFAELTAAATGEARATRLAETASEDYWSDWAEAGGLAILPQTKAWAMPVSEIMTPMAYSLGPDTPVQDAAGALYRGAMHRVLVTENGKLLGIVTTTDIVKAVADGRLSA
jgi:CBS domain-containing protein